MPSSRKTSLRKSPRLGSPQSSQDSIFSTKQSKSKKSMRAERCKNFEPDELEMLSRELEKRGDRPATTRTFKRLAVMLNEKFHNKRTANQLRTRAKRDKGAAKKLVTNFKRNAVKTGGGEPEKEPTELELRLINTINPKAFRGIEGGIDTSKTNSEIDEELHSLPNSPAKSSHPSDEDINDVNSSTPSEFACVGTGRETIVNSPVVEQGNAGNLVNTESFGSKKKVCVNKNNVGSKNIDKHEIFKQQDTLISILKENNNDLKVVAVLLKRNHTDLKEAINHQTNVFNDVAAKLDKLNSNLEKLSQINMV